MGMDPISETMCISHMPETMDSPTQYSYNDNVWTLLLMMVVIIIIIIIISRFYFITYTILQV
jgi:magnesium-transporting ATPase (P-type)